MFHVSWGCCILNIGEVLTSAGKAVVYSSLCGPMTLSPPAHTRRCLLCHEAPTYVLHPVILSALCRFKIQKYKNIHSFRCGRLAVELSIILN